MKLNPIQIAASAVGAVFAAVIASFFGVQGTIIGVLVGSIVASTGSVIMFQSMERTHQAVRQVVSDPKRSGFLRNRGGTSAAGSVTARTEEPGPAAGAGVQPEQGGSTTGAERTRRLERSSGAEVVGDSETAAGRAMTSERRLVARSGPGRQGGQRLPGPARGGSGSPGGPTGNVGTGRLRPRRRFGWPVVVLTSVVALAVALGVITVVELAAGETLSTLFGVHGAGGKTSIGAFVAPSPTTTTTTTTTTPSSTTTTTPSTTTTTTTTPSSTTTTTTSPSSSTTTTAPGATTTTPSSTSTTLPTGTATTLTAKP